MSKVAMVIAAHPDDIEFMMAGTLSLLKNAGYEIHYMNLSTGNCGSLETDSATTTRIRLEEAKNAARILGAEFHAPITNDFEILYGLELLRKLAAVVRSVKPQIILTHSPSDYMEDHMNTSRLATTAAFVRGIPNFDAHVPAVGNYDCAIYHAMPHGLLDSLRRKVIPGIFVDTGTVVDIKREALMAHKSQQNWLEDSQGMNSYIKTQEDFSLKVGKMSGRFTHAEGWRRHLHFGFSANEYDPLEQLGPLYFNAETQEI
ncbi:MAG TPA: PIG-L deacetylase family protein [Chryseosolibacter sp.]